MRDEGQLPGFMAAIVDHVAHPVFVKDRAFAFVFLNQAMCRMVGYSREQMLGKTDYDFFPKAEADFFRQIDIELFATLKEIEIKQELITDAAGNRHVLATTKVPLLGPGGEVTHLVGIIHDITAQKLAEDALRAANEELERRVGERTRELASAQLELLRKERLAVLGRLVGGLAHQIRNPLGAIVNAAAILSKSIGPQATPHMLKALEVINEEVWRANRTITDLIDFARIRPAEPRTVCLQALVDATLRTHGLPDRVTATVDISPALEVRVDGEQVQGALGHLVTNAVEAMDHGGVLSFSARQENAEVVLQIEDTGPGIAPAIWDHLFEPLMTTKPFGLGLGLTTCRALIANQGGSITCTSAQGKGTRFEVRLPGGAA